jgi:hypothetical protein
MVYGDRRDYPEIDLYAGGRYLCSTTWSRTCREALQRCPQADKAHFSKETRRA